MRIRLKLCPQLRAPTKKLLFSGILFGLPCPFIVVFSLLTIRALRSMRKSYYMDNAKLQMWCKVESSITFMIVTSSAVFLTLNGPLFVVCLICFLVETFSDQVDVELRSRVVLFFIFLVQRNILPVPCYSQYNDIFKKKRKLIIFLSLFLYTKSTLT